MAQLDEISVAIGRLQASVESVAANQTSHQARDDAQHEVTQSMVNVLTKHVNHENELMSKRVTDLEHDQTQRKARSRLVIAAGSTVTAIITVLVLALAVPWHHLGF